MNKRLLLALLAFILLLPAAAAFAQQESYNDVVLIINDSSWASKTIGTFFASRRNIPTANIMHIAVDTSETMDSATFIPLRWQMEAWMQTKNLGQSINYIVTTKGCPLRVATRQHDSSDRYIVAIGGQSSFEDCLALMNGKDSVYSLSVKSGFPISRYFGSVQHFKRDAETLPMYLVTRLDAYTVDQVKGIIMKAETPSFLGDGEWVLDLDPTKDGGGGYQAGNDWLRGADTVLVSRGMNVYFNTDTAYVRNRTNVIGYGSWGSNDAYSGGQNGAIPHNTWLNGSVAETFVSTGGRTFTPGSNPGQSLVADWLAEGASSVKGYTDEPYLISLAHVNILDDRYTSGFNMAESYFAASNFIAWRQVVIGDPKMKLALMAQPQKSADDFGSQYRYTTTADTLWLRNKTTSSLSLKKVYVDGDSSQFAAKLLTGALPLNIAAGDSIGVRVEYMPNQYGPANATLVANLVRASDNRNTATLVPLSGTGTTPALTVPTLYDFGAVTNGTQSDYTLSLTNPTETDTIKINSYSLGGKGKTQFKVTPSVKVPAALAGGATEALDIQYTPSGTGRDSATLTIYTSLPGNPYQLKLYGNGVVAGIENQTLAGNISLEISPNPVQGIGSLQYSIASGGTVSCELLDIRGTRIRTLYSGIQGQGAHTIVLDASNLAAGAYLCRINVVENNGRSTSAIRHILVVK